VPSFRLVGDIRNYSIVAFIQSTCEVAKCLKFNPEWLHFSPYKLVHKQARGPITLLLLSTFEREDISAGSDRDNLQFELEPTDLESDSGIILMRHHLWFDLTLPRRSTRTQGVSLFCAIYASSLKFFSLQNGETSM